MEIKQLQALLVEPSNIQQRIIQAEFERLGISDIRSCKTGDLALQEMQRTQPDLVVSAMYLADMTGSDLLQKMRSEEMLREIAFILVSSETDLDALEPIRQAGAVAILPKPFHHRNLECAINATIDYYEPGEIALESEDIEDIRVLLVDDSLMARNHFKRVLGKMGIMNFTEAENGRIAVELMQQSYFDLVITDYNMPEMDGQQLVEYIRGYGEQRSIPILMVTSEESGRRLSAVRQAGVSAICDKPFESGVIRDLLQGMLSGNAA